MSALSSFTTRDGVRIAYETHGDTKSERRALLIHSLAMDHAYWRPVAERLAEQGACCVALDCRGHGGSDKPSGPYSVDAFADDCRDLLDELNWRQAVVAGSSMGGSVALSLAVRYPDRVAGLALIDTTACYGEDAPKAWGRARRRGPEQGARLAQKSFRPRDGSATRSAKSAPRSWRRASTRS